MPLFLSERNEKLVEWMDRPDADPELLSNTYSQFSRINRLLSGWKKIYNDFIKPEIIKNSRKASILDIGCGGGDIIRYLSNLSSQDGFEVTLTGIDPDERSIRYLKRQHWPNGVDFYQKSAEDLLRENHSFDIVITNHLVHHLTNREVTGMCQSAEKLAKKLVLFSDIERSDFGYLSFQLAAPLLFRNSYIVKDGLISIRKSFRKHELEQLLPEEWIVQRRFPFRLLAIHKNDPS